MTYAFIGIDHVQLAAPEGCEPDARSFFGKLLGWEEIPKPESLRPRGGVWFQCGAHQVHIGVQKDFAPATKAHPAFEVRNIRLLRQHLVRNRVSIIEDDAREIEECERFFLKDPFGNRLEFIEWRVARDE
ncbi:VOC family protein [Cohnella luojiensis]|uniref:Glyoxalase n=1 Tax=Cohnella luojiensis TaxID=652876 RepID=A0A4Y8LXM4_9BACL|nr:VOC family protein [Cohnella luojiensis]TFE25952.1 glyoxalase [Cohnella luojiensis]